jgi:hypothetical protein
MNVTKGRQNVCRFSELVCTWHNMTAPSDNARNKALSD